jgi:hypothetical protein
MECEAENLNGKQNFDLIAFYRLEKFEGFEPVGNVENLENNDNSNKSFF